MASSWERMLRVPALAGVIFACAFGLAGCGGGGGDDDPLPEPDQDVDTFLLPTIGYAPRVTSAASDLDPVGRPGQVTLGTLVSGTAATVRFDAPRIEVMTNTAVAAAGSQFRVTIQWRDLGSDVNSCAIQLHCAAVTATPVFTTFPMPELAGQANATSVLTFNLDNLNSDAGYEIVLALGDAQGNLSPVFRGALVVTVWGHDPAFAQVTRDLVNRAGDNPPALGQEQAWFPTGGFIEDSIPNGLEGSLPSRVSQDIALAVQQPAGTNAINLVDLPGATRRGVIYGDQVFKEFTYNFCYQYVTVSPTCIAVWATGGTGNAIDEERFDRIDKRLEINEVRAFIGAYDPTVAGAPVLSDPRGTQPLGCPADAFPTRFINEFVVYVR